MSRRVPRGQQTRDLIMTVALREFAERGYHEVTMEEIAAAAGVTKGAVYYWFIDKDDLGRELQHELYDRLTSTALRSLDLEGDVVSNMVEAFHAYLDAVGDLGEARFFLRDAWVIPALDEAGRRDHEDAIDMVRELLAVGIARGELLAFDPDALARVLMGAWAEATLHVLRTGNRDVTVDVVRHLIESLRVSAEPEQAPVRSPRRRGAART